MAANQSDLERLRQAMNTRLKELMHSTESSADSRRPVELDQTSVGRLSRMDALQMQAMAQAAERMRGREIDRIRAALKRLDDGEFGYCAVCGEEIAPRRLELDPTVAACIQCASAADQ